MYGLLVYADWGFLDWEVSVFSKLCNHSSIPTFVFVLFYHN